jgi:hypothetical protein
MIKVYPDRVGPAVARLFGDVASVVWTVAWALLGVLIYRAVMGLQAIADGITSTGHTLNSWIESFKNAVPGGIPGISDFFNNVADQLRQHSGDPLVAAGQDVHDAIFRLAIILGLFVALPPILLVLIPYVTWRWRDMRELGSALAFVRIASVTGRADQARAVLAMRAVTMLSFRQLMSASADPVGDLAEHRYDRLANAMLRRAGLDTSRLAPPELPELPAPGDS